MKKIKTIAHKVAHGFIRAEQPFHLTYLAAGAHYYNEHHVPTLALAAAGLFLVTLVHYLGELFGERS